MGVLVVLHMCWQPAQMMLTPCALVRGYIQNPVPEVRLELTTSAWVRLAYGCPCVATHVLATCSGDAYPVRGNIQKPVPKVRLELTTSACLTTCTDYKYGALTDCATRASRNFLCRIRIIYISHVDDLICRKCAYIRQTLADGRPQGVSFNS